MKVGDFGVARLAEGSTDGRGSHPASIVGTPRYMAPEQGRGRATTPATDVYSAGVVLYEMLVGRAAVQRRLGGRTGAAAPAGAPAAAVAPAPGPAGRDRRAGAGQGPGPALRRRRRDGRRAARRPAEAAPSAGPRRRPPPSARPPRRWRRRSRGSSTSDRPPRRPPASRAPTPRRPPRGPHGTRRVAPPSPRRNVNPAGRRRATAALGVVIALLGAMVVAALVIGHTSYTHVPRLVHESQGRAVAAARRAHVKLDARPPPLARAGRTPSSPRPRVPDAGWPLAPASRVTLSSGPAPVQVLTVRHETVGDAEQSLHSAGLRTTVHDVPAPGITPGTVVGQEPAGGTSRPRGSTVTLSVAEVPQWRTVTTFTGRGSGAFHITRRATGASSTDGLPGHLHVDLVLLGPDGARRRRAPPGATSPASACRTAPARCRPSPAARATTRSR